MNAVKFFLRWVLCLFLVACGGGGGGGAGDLITGIDGIGSKPSDLSYERLHDVHVVGVESASNKPTVSGSPAESFSVTPQLPKGLTLNGSNGVISGTPLVSSPLADYVVTATNAYGSATVTLKLEVKEPVMPPEALSLEYSNKQVEYVVGQVIPENQPISNTVFNQFEVSPALPNGLTLDSSTGIIRGQPTVAALERPYTITARNAEGSATTSILISVVDQVVAPSRLIYPIANVVLKQGQAVPAGLMLPTYDGTVVDGFTLVSSFSLPAGLSLNSATGEISGAPTALSLSRMYVVQATNAAGSVKAMLRIMVTKDEVLPTAFDYPDGRSFKVGELIELAPVISGGTEFTRFALASGVLPTGLTLNEKTGMITGVADATAVGSYTIRVNGRNGAGTMSSNLFNFSIQSDIPAPPANLHYTDSWIGSRNSLVYGYFDKGDLVYPCAGLTATEELLCWDTEEFIEWENLINFHAYPPRIAKYEGAELVRFEVSPSLPDGVRFEPSTGEIWGWPKAKIDPGQDFTITGFDAFGRSVQVVIQIKAPFAAVYNLDPIQVSVPGFNPQWVRNYTSYTLVAGSMRVNEAEQYCQDLGYQLITAAEGVALASLKPLQAEWGWPNNSNYKGYYKTSTRNKENRPLVVDIFSGTVSENSDSFEDYDLPHVVACAYNAWW